MKNLLFLRDSEIIEAWIADSLDDQAYLLASWERSLSPWFSAASLFWQLLNFLCSSSYKDLRVFCYSYGCWIFRVKRSEKKEFISPLLLSIFLSLTMCCFLFPYSIEFDRDFDYFAIAGVTKKIKVLYVKETVLFSISLLGDIKGRKSLFLLQSTRL